MKKYCIFYIVLFLFMALTSLLADDYTVGVGDILEVNILKPDQTISQVTVTPGGSISVPYIGSVTVKGKTITQIQKDIQWRLANGYLKYPVVTVSLIESRSRKFTISGEVNDPGSYALEENTTVLKAISIAGGFTRFGSSSRVKILRPRKDRPGYLSIKIDIQAIMDGDARADVVLEPGDIVVVSEGLF
ncbi:MAG: polysaccharide export protein [Spirochaetes bacterium]|jgi:polysaccharide export outer membrane protein|nr:polysaccharide export protein [Spirochaetota bacterium]